MGRRAFAFDMMPHVGVEDGMHDAMARNGDGVTTLTHLATVAARMILGGSNKASAYSRIPFETRPPYSGHPGFMPFIGTAYQLRDRMDGWRLRDRKH